MVGLALAFGCVACGGVQGAGGNSAGSCVAPYLNDQPPDGVVGGPAPTVSPGGTLTVYGHWYTSTCNDTGQHAPLKALAPVHLTVTLPGGAVEELGEFHPQGNDMGFSTTVRIPVGTPAGPADIHDDRAPEAHFQFAIGN